MQAISRIITRVHFKEYNIPESFGEEAQVIILPVENSSLDIELELDKNKNPQKKNDKIISKGEIKYQNPTTYIEQNMDFW